MQLGALSSDRVLRLAAETGDRPERIAVKLGLITDAEMAAFYADHLGSPTLATGDYPEQPIDALGFQADFLRHHRVCPLRLDQDGFIVALADPLDEAVIRALAFAVQRPVLRRVGLPTDIEAALQRLYSPSQAGTTSDDARAFVEEDRDADLERLRDLASEAPVIRLVDAMIARAVELGSSDIHIEAAEVGLRVRYRIDGVLRDIEPPSARLKAAVVSRVKIMARMNIAERRLAQDGRIRQIVRGQEIDLRVSTAPAIHGESVVLRILDRGSLALDFAAIGFDADLLPAWRDVTGRPHGIVLVTGPTGSGKTTTLYTTLHELNAAERKILTIEDPVEYVLAGVNQVQVKPQIGLTFASALRSFLRQDPDIMMIGEIRDLETAQIAVQAALTGHLVLSTVHTNDAASAVTRLLDMGVENYLLPSTLNGVLAQRLVRKLCTACREPYAATDELIFQLGLARSTSAPMILHRAAGCPSCNGTGYRGRTMILELMPMTEAIRPLVLRRADARDLQAAAVVQGMQTMHGHGLRKVVAGVTTLEEVYRVIRDG